MHFTADTDSDMEILLSVIGESLGELGAEAVVDLYLDAPLTSRRAQERFDIMVTESRENSERRDPLMAVPLHLASAEGVQRFSLLGFRTIGSEAFLKGKLVFASIENERTVWLDLPSSEISRVEESARSKGAESVRRIR